MCYYFFSPMQLMANKKMKWKWNDYFCCIHIFWAKLLICSLINLMYHSIPKPPIPPFPRAMPEHLTRVKLHTVGNLTQNEAHPVGHLTFVSKRLSAVGSKRISQFFDSAREPRSRVIAFVDSTWVFLLLSFYIVISWYMPLFKVWSEDKLNKKFIVPGGGFDPLWSSNGWGIWPSKLAT